MYSMEKVFMFLRVYALERVRIKAFELFSKYNFPPPFALWFTVDMVVSKISNALKSYLYFLNYIPASFLYDINCKLKKKTSRLVLC